jgi:alpha-galactosidase
MSCFRLDGATCTLLLLQHPQGLPEIVHWGARLPDGLALDALPALRERGVRPNSLDQDVPQATLLPTLGAGTFHAPGLATHRDTQDWTADFSDVAVRQQPDGLTVGATDKIAGIGLRIHLGLAPAEDVLTMRIELTNTGTTPLHIATLAAGVFLTPDRASELLTFDGYWGHEFTERRLPLVAGLFASENRRGRLSHDRFPALIAGTAGLSEDSGEVWGFHLGWSGNHRSTAERLDDGRALVMLGELYHPGEAMLAAGATLTTPVAFAAYSDSGLSGLSRKFHAHVRAHVLRWPNGRMAPRPVTLNTWEGTYFAHDLARLKQQATAAAALGIERFVLDDGWMKGRHDDTAGLGDWIADPQKYPDGLAPLATHVIGLGMQFGLWVEPEMVNPDSDFFRAHPDAVLHVAGRPLRTARHQLVLDLTRTHVADAIHASIDTLLRELPIAYLKWDMNRDLVAAGDAAGRPAYHAQVLALYALLDRLRAAHPLVEIESCASGGGRPDYGILARTHRVWTSDCTDALQRLTIQRGASRFLPPEILGAHIAASPNHQTGRRHTLGFRAAVALFFHLGVELDPLLLGETEAAEIAAWIALHKRLRPLLHHGHHVAAPALAGRSLRGVVAHTGVEAAFLVAQEVASDRRLAAPLLLPGLDAAATYRLTAPAPQRPPARASAAASRLFGDGLIVAGALLGHVGLAAPDLPPESALVLHATRLEGHP